MGAGIALQSAAIEPRIEAVIAEASFCNLREAAYDYAGSEKTLFRPVVWAVIHGAKNEGGFLPDDVSPEKAVALRPFPVFPGAREH